jgi:UDP:flavonoid glycosyltransferase YjiC (YdhE family)
MEAMDAGVPMLMVPLCNDQHLQARFLVQAGAGRVISVEEAEHNADLLHQALATLLDPGAPERQRATAVSKTYQVADGAQMAAELLMNVAGNR